MVVQVTNCIFRMGGVAVILSNKSKHRAQSKYQLLHLIRTHTGYEERSYQCVHQKEDPDGLPGFALARSLPITAGEALRINMTTLAPLVLPATERLRFALNYVHRRFWEKGAKPYVPNFRLAFNHFCIHAGGPAVVESVQRNLQLSLNEAEASWMTLYRFGNTSSSSPWYSMAYTEAKRRVKKGDKLLQIALGSGFKSSTATWKSLRTVQPTIGNAWLDCIDDFPLEVSRKQSLHEVGDRK